VRLDVVGRDGAVTFLSPFDRPAPVRTRERPRRASRQQGLARLAGLLGAASGYRDPSAACRADVTLLPYQLEPAMALLAGSRRLLVADEVGLGKTIQAGLAVAELLRREPGARVLVLVPASLRDQWTAELAGRFAIDALPADQAALRAAARRGAFGDNPWDRAGVWMASLDFVKQPHVLESLPLSPWDLLVVDEAHDATGDSARHAAGDKLARRARRVMLLTATPHSGDAARFDRLLQLGALPADDPPRVFRRTRRGLGLPAGRRIRWLTVPASSAERRLLDALLAFERRVLSAGARADLDRSVLLLSVFRKRALSTACALRRSIDRRLAWLARERGTGPDWLQPSLDLGLNAPEDDLTPADARALMADVGLAAGHERSWLKRLRGLALAAERHESRVGKLVALLARTREPAVVFTEFRDSLDTLSRWLAGVRAAALLHGGLTQPERRRELRRFLDGDVSLLIATDVAGQGLNLQSRARWTINLELPWNPARLEQRAGRVDRIGQTRDVRVSLMVLRHEAESALVTRLARRVFAARKALGNDTLEVSLPDETDVAQAVLGADAATRPPALDVGPATAVAPAVRLCRRWQRPAAALARRLERQRRWLRSWQAPALPVGAVRFAWPRLDARSGPPAGVRLVFIVPILDGLGMPVEQHVVAVATGAPTARDSLDDGGLPVARQAAAARVAPRARRLARLLAAEGRRRQRLDGILVRRLAAAVDTGERQHGLFDRRAARAAASALEAVAVVADTRLAATEDDDLRAEVFVGRPALALVIGPP